jgi:hypothetical protein
MTTTTTMAHKISVIGEQNNPFGGIDATLKLDIWQDGSGKLLVRLAKNDGEFETYANETFRDCETQHQDSERWLNDKIGYPNPFAGILLHQDWE